MRVVAGAIIYRITKRKLEVLLVHQSDKNKNLWSLPKGGADKGEANEAAARREVLEETGVKAGQLEFLGYVNYGHKRLYCFMGLVPPDQTLKAHPPEIDNAGFFDVARAKKMVDKRQRPLIIALQKILTFSKRKNVSA
jgi:predicted NUDIX family NTP pyrophosphohydrolase